MSVLGDALSVIQHLCAKLALEDFIFTKVNVKMFVLPKPTTHGPKVSVRLAHSPIVLPVLRPTATDAKVEHICTTETV